METAKLILQFLLGGSKWPLIALTVFFLAVGGYTIYSIMTLQSELQTQKLNNEIMKSNIEKLETAKKLQDTTIKNYENILKTANSSNEAMIKMLQQQTIQTDLLFKKLNQISPKKALANPTEFQAKVNITMQMLNKCFEDLAKKPITGKKNEDIICTIDSLPDFSK